MTRKAFLLALPETLVGAKLAAPAPGKKLLIVAAHPDDEYAFAGAVYRLTHELGWVADHVVITNGEGGYRYSALAEAIYGVGLTNESEGRRVACLPFANAKPWQQGRCWACGAITF